MGLALSMPDEGPMPDLPDFNSAHNADNRQNDNRPSLIPIQLRRQAPDRPGPIAVTSLPVAQSIIHDLIPTIFPSPDILDLEREAIGEPPNKKRHQSASSSTDLTDGNEDWLPSEGKGVPEQQESISIADTPLHRLLLFHALLGFSSQTAPFAMRALLEARLMLRHRHASSGSAEPNGTAQADTPEMCQQSIRRSAAVFERNILAVNLHSLSMMLCSSRVWAFTIAVEPSPYFGRAGLEARVCLYGPQRRLVSFHLAGIMHPSPDISRLRYLLHSLCPLAPYKCLGVVAHLEPKEAATNVAGTVAAVVGHLHGLTTRGVRFLTPDMVARKKCPPLLPLEVAATSTDAVIELVQHYRTRLEKSWGAEQIGRISSEHKLLCDEFAGWIRKTDDAEAGTEKRKSLAEFDKAWDFAGDRFLALRDFLGALASAYFYTPQKRESPSISGLEIGDEDNCSSALAADLILQEQQFEQLRSYVAT